MAVLRLTEDSAGISDFSDLAMPLNAGTFALPAPAMPISATESATGLLYLILPAGWDGAQHPSPRRQVAFCLSGRLRVEAGDGEVRESGPGAISRMEDFTGMGHTTTVIGREDMRRAIVQLPPLPGDTTLKEIP
ncbi:MAG: cupin [Paracoccaceae bacterium]